ncbi:translesion error-prone DNA polymerase V autoproteolytic subunit [Lutibacter sp. TH_r2]|uniref:LexA family protein n=1 Tax=Lutibacter sp. TH_r2 TaxID=3082083 RepID=UPI002953D285|nr:translesion error-prone DNA polymerase V autoproteolytic subunit [Lutibacter sp. TH_r2]MDV7188536.1 translesion error-prone DNA polymerase V autoproteolytic subunit [Lutibacter sp. TH_r2]
MKDKKLEIFRVKALKNIKRPIINEDIHAGFPSPAEDFQELRISLDKELITNEDATFYARVRGNSMIDANIEDGDLLVIDRSIESRDGRVAVCMIDGDFTVKRIKLGDNCLYLMPENSKYKPIKITDENEFIVWGIVTYVIKKV